MKHLFLLGICFICTGALSAQHCLNNPDPKGPGNPSETATLGGKLIINWVNNGDYGSSLSNQSSDFVAFGEYTNLCDYYVYAGSAALTISNTATPPGGRLNVQWKNIYKVLYNIEDIITEASEPMYEIVIQGIAANREPITEKWYATEANFQTELERTKQVVRDKLADGDAAAAFCESEATQSSISAAGCVSYAYLGATYENSSVNTLSNRSADFSDSGDPSKLCEYTASTGSATMTITKTTIETQIWEKYIKNFTATTRHEMSITLKMDGMDCTSSNPELPADTEQLQLASNPMGSQIKFLNYEIRHMDIYDFSGRRVLSQSVENNEASIQQLIRGAYIVSAQDREGRMHRVKMVRK